ncbi:MAG: hypothetical protein DMF01_07190 [Verrucomicrobia bacterium]|nr:MAG: hypothetical protein DMF01_07190 [Verrucomicrobiota bacterium]
MTRNNLLCAVVIAFATPFANCAEEPPIKVDISQLIKHPKKYNGQRIEVTGYFVSSCEFCFSLWPDIRTARQSDTYQRRIAVGKAAPHVNIPNPPSEFDGYVHVVGTFRYKRLWRRQHPDKTDSHVEIVEANMGYGMGGLDDKELTKITEFRILSRRIPLGKW